mmetsp:Transcript_17306/g.35277  ORF Transcript_17306/g.35277 Transcript_17306/m.35277 type:complete len:200 (-) Transcript_17306:197-796(-)
MDSRCGKTTSFRPLKLRSRRWSWCNLYAPKFIIARTSVAAAESCLVGGPDGGAEGEGAPPPPPLPQEEGMAEARGGGGAPTAGTLVGDAGTKALPGTNSLAATFIFGLGGVSRLRVSIPRDCKPTSSSKMSAGTPPPPTSSPPPLEGLPSPSLCCGTPIESMAAKISSSWSSSSLPPPLPPPPSKPLQPPSCWPYPACW